MSEHGILFQDEMVRAILDGRKTVTRRTSDVWAKRKAGDRLWVREAWSLGRVLRDCEGIPDDELMWTGPLPKADPRGARLIDDWSVGYRATSGSYGPWRPSIHMPRWAARLTLEVESVTMEQGFGCDNPGGFCECQRLCCMSRSGCIQLPAVDDDEARREGVADRAAYLALWREINGDTVPDHVWRIAFRVLS